MGVRHPGLVADFAHRGPGGCGLPRLRPAGHAAAAASHEARANEAVVHVQEAHLRALGRRGLGNSTPPSANLARNPEMSGGHLGATRVSRRLGTPWRSFPNSEIHRFRSHARSQSPAEGMIDSGVPLQTGGAAAFGNLESEGCNLGYLGPRILDHVPTFLGQIWRPENGHQIETVVLICFIKGARKRAPNQAHKSAENPFLG